MQRVGWPEEERRDQGFSCSEGLLRAFREHATRLGCSPDWLFAEALRRVLAEPVPEPVAEPVPEPVAELVPAPSNDVDAPTRARPTAPLPPPLPHRSRPDAGRIRLRVQTAEGILGAVATDGMVIGRSESETNLMLRHAGVSRKHVRIERRKGGWVVVDLASFNGVYVNSVRTRCSPIVPGDVIDIGPFAVHVEQG